MNLFPKILLLSCLFLISLNPVSYGQQDTSENHISNNSTEIPGVKKDNEQDDEFNLFLFTIASVFIAGVMGAALVGAMVAVLIFLLLFALVSFGVLSTSIIIGLYKRSVAAGFKTFITIILTGGCTLIGVIGLWLSNHLFNLSFSNHTTLLVGILSGALAGILLSLTTFRILKFAIGILQQKIIGIL